MKATVRIEKDDRGNSWVLVDQEEIQRRAEEKLKENYSENLKDYGIKADKYWYMRIVERKDKQTAVIEESPADHMDGTYYHHLITSTETQVIITNPHQRAGLNGNIFISREELDRYTDILDLLPTSELQARLVRGWTDLIGESRERYKNSITGAKENAFTIASALRCAKRFCEIQEMEEEEESNED